MDPDSPEDVVVGGGLKPLFNIVTTSFDSEKVTMAAAARFGTSSMNAKLVKPRPRVIRHLLTHDAVHDDIDPSLSTAASLPWFEVVCQVRSGLHYPLRILRLLIGTVRLIKQGKVVGLHQVGNVKSGNVAKEPKLGNRSARMELWGIWDVRSLCPTRNSWDYFGKNCCSNSRSSAILYVRYLPSRAGGISLTERDDDPRSGFSFTRTCRYQDAIGRERRA
jgi:hypothetical protein